MKSSLIAVAFILTISTVSFAHHSGAGVDRTKSVSITGTLKEFKWANPHSWMEIEVPNDKGGTDLWAVEMNPPSFLVRAGWRSNSVKPGDKVTVVVRPFRNGDPGGIFVSVTLPDGQVLGELPPQPLGPAPASASAPR